MSYFGECGLCRVSRNLAIIFEKPAEDGAEGYCSDCKDELDREQGLSDDEDDEPWNACPDCGAELDGDGFCSVCCDYTEVAEERVEA